jgi:hypothetical protein
MKSAPSFKPPLWELFVPTANFVLLYRWMGEFRGPCPNSFIPGKQRCVRAHTSRQLLPLVLFVETEGTGGFGRVYCVQHLSSEYYAMEVLKKELLKQLNQLAHTLNKRKILGSSPFIVKLAFLTPEILLWWWTTHKELLVYIRKLGRLTEDNTGFYAEILLWTGCNP